MSCSGAKNATSPHYHLRCCSGSLGNQNSCDEQLKKQFFFSLASFPPLLLMVLCFFLLHAVANFGSAAECWWDTCLLCEIPTAIFGQYLAWTASSLRTKGVCLSGSLEKFNASLWLAKKLSGFTKPTSHYWQIPAALWAFPAVGWLSLWEHENHNKMHFYSISKRKINAVFVKCLLIYFATVFFSVGQM